jgi:hypothetical protein
MGTAVRELQRRIASLPVTARNYLGRRIITTSGRYEPTPGTRAVLLRMTGGGGGGGGGTGGGSFAFGGGGWSGVYFEQWVASSAPIAGGAVTIGAAGAAGAAGAQGGTGGTTTASINGRTYSAPGGAGGLGATNGAGAAVTGIPTTPAGVTSGADFNIQERGEQGIRIGAGAGWPGSGGNTPLGSGAATTGSGNGGNANVGYGGGGGGALAGVSNQTGGTGGIGVVIIEEYA